MKVRISTSKNVDARQLDNLWRSIWIRRGVAKWKEVLSKSRFVCSAWDGKKLVGFGRIVEDGTMCMFYDIAVHPEYRRKGVGTRIMNELVRKIKKKKYASIGLFAWKENPANISFYKKFGFVRVATGMELVKLMKKE